MDSHRKPAEMLAFLGVKPGMRVGELASGMGYTTELLARVVGSQGVVYAQNTPLVLKLFAAQPLAARLERPVNKCVIHVEREMDDPFPPEAKDLDLVVIFGAYHDTDAGGLMQADRTKMNRAIFATLKPGGRYAVFDSSAKPGTGVSETARLHRIDEALVQREVESAGFKLERSGDFLRNPADPRDWDTNPMAAGDKRGTGDRFALLFVKP